jgi:hypothetical protein
MLQAGRRYYWRVYVAELGKRSPEAHISLGVTVSNLPVARDRRRKDLRQNQIS